MNTFTESEREAIRAKLISQGKESFGTRGLKGTNISGLARSAGIAAGSFYAFFESKERLFYEILIETYTGNGPAFEALAKHEANPVSTLFAFMNNALESFKANPLMKQMIDGESRAILRRKLSAAEWQDLEDASNGFLERFVTAWQAKGHIIAGKPQVIARLLTAHFFIHRHSEEIGSDLTGEVIQLYTKVVAEGLTGRRY